MWVQKYLLCDLNIKWPIIFYKNIKNMIGNKKNSFCILSNIYWNENVNLFRKLFRTKKQRENNKRKNDELKKSINSCPWLIKGHVRIFEQSSWHR